MIPTYATIRDGLEDDGTITLHIECRFPNGDKYVGAEVDSEHEDFALLICAAPEMLEALKGFVSAYKKEDKNKIAYWADYAQELIKKSEGN